MAGAMCYVFTNGRQHDVARRPFNQVDTEFIFEFAYLGAERRLADKAGLSSLAEMFQFGKLDEILECA